MCTYTVCSILDIYIRCVCPQQCRRTEIVVQQQLFIIFIRSCSNEIQYVIFMSLTVYIVSTPATAAAVFTTERLVYAAETHSLCRGAGIIRSAAYVLYHTAMIYYYSVVRYHTFYIVPLYYTILLYYTAIIYTLLYYSILFTVHYIVLHVILLGQLFTIQWEQINK